MYNYVNVYNYVGLGGPDTESDTLSLQLLLLISSEEDGIKAIFKSTNSFMHLVNRVLLETEDRFYYYRYY